jgi:hypothetical protein
LSLWQFVITAMGNCPISNQWPHLPYLQKLEKEEQIKHNISRKKEIIKNESRSQWNRNRKSVKPNAGCWEHW